MSRVLAIACCLLALEACGSGGASHPKASSTTSSSTTSTAPQASIEVRPPSGPVGAFQLVGTNFQPGEMVTFEIDFPDGKVFKGQPHKATPEGAVTATYRATAGNPAGTYQVKATGDHGTQGTGQFQVTAPGATTLPSRAVTTSTSHVATTKKG